MRREQESGITSKKLRKRAERRRRRRGRMYQIPWQSFATLDCVAVKIKFASLARAFAPPPLKPKRGEGRGGGLGSRSGDWEA